MKVLFSSCKEEQHATDADIDNMLNNKHPETTTGKCMAHCVMKQFTVVNEICFFFVPPFSLQSILILHHFID